MKKSTFSLILCLTAIFLCFLSEKTYAQKTDTLPHIKHHTENEIYAKPHFQGWLSANYSSFSSDEETFMWHAQSFGMRPTAYYSMLDGNINLLGYGELFYEKSETEFYNSAHAQIHQEEGLVLEVGCGVKFSVPFAESGFKIEGEFTTPFNFFRPAFEPRLTWTNELIEVSLGDKIVLEYTSILNPVLTIGYHLPFKNKHQKQKED